MSVLKGMKVNTSLRKKNNAVIIIDTIKCLTRLKWVKRIKEGWTEKLVTFNLNDLARSQFIKYQIRTKYNVSLLNPHLDSDETKVMCD